MSDKKKKARRKLERRASGHSATHAKRIKWTPAGRCLIYRRTLALFSTIKHQSKLETEDTRLRPVLFIH